MDGAARVGVDSDGDVGEGGGSGGEGGGRSGTVGAGDVCVDRRLSWTAGCVGGSGLSAEFEFEAPVLPTMLFLISLGSFGSLTNESRDSRRPATALADSLDGRGEWAVELEASLTLRLRSERSALSGRSGEVTLKTRRSIF